MVPALSGSQEGREDVKAFPLYPDFSLLAPGLRPFVILNEVKDLSKKCKKNLQSMKKSVPLQSQFERNSLETQE